MKRTILAALLLAAAPFAFAQATDAPKPADSAAMADVPKPTCGSSPELPGRTIMQDTGVRKRFEDDVKKYTECVKAYTSAREAAIKANRDAANQMINDYNSWQASIMEEQKKRRGESTTTEGGAAQPKTY